MDAADGTLFDGRTALGATVSIVAEGPCLRLISADGQLLATWLLAGMVRCYREAPSDSASFRQATGPGRLLVTNPAVLAGLRLAGVDPGQAPSWGARGWAAFGAASVASLLVGAALVDQLPGLAAPLVPASLERGWSTTIEGVLAVGSRSCSTSAGDAALSGLIVRLASAAGLAHPPAIAVLDTGLVNAFTLPDGRILLLRGLIDKAVSPDEVSGVLAHEIGHVRRHDPTREMLRGIALNMVARGLGWGSSVAGQMAALSYGRRAEAAADASAVATLRRAGLRADGLRSFFVRLQSEAGDGPLPFLSDHPATAQRIAILPADLAGATALTPLEWQALRAECRG